MRYLGSINNENMIDKEKLEDCWIDAIDHCEDRIAGVLSVYKNFEEWYDDNVASDGVLADVSDLQELQEIAETLMQSENLAASVEILRHFADKCLRQG